MIFPYSDALQLALAKSAGPRPRVHVGLQSVSDTVRTKDTLKAKIDSHMNDAWPAGKLNCKCICSDNHARSAQLHMLNAATYRALRCAEGGITSVACHNARVRLSTWPRESLRGGKPGQDVGDL
jgi:hypothetical protein